MNDNFSLPPNSTSTPMGLRERKKRLTQATIEATALHLFQQHGYEQTSIQDIADAVMMSPRTFFRYFSSKEDILFSPTRTVLNEGIRYLQQLPPTESPHMALRTTFLYLASLYQEQRANFLIRYQVAMKTPTLASMYLLSLAVMEPAMCDTLSRSQVKEQRDDMCLLVAICMAAFRVTLEIWLRQEATGNLSALLDSNLKQILILPIPPRG